jgi:hypothetical protein
MEYMERRQAGTLADFLIAQSKGLTHEGENFNPSIWHTDAMPDQLRNRWMDALDYLRQLQEAGSPYFEEIFRKVRADYDTSREYLLAQPSEGKFVWGQRQVLETIGARWRKQFTIENSFYLAERAEEGFKPTEYDPSNDPKPVEKSQEIPPEKRWWEGA